VPRSSDIQILQATGDRLELVRSLWREYWAGFAFSECFQNFADELSALPGDYAPPQGRLLLAFCDEHPAGTAAFRRLNDDSCEGKRLYVRPQYRQQGIGKLLLDQLIEEARVCGYREMYGDTLKSMQTALDMYLRYGFVEVPPYSEKPTQGAIYLKLAL
jgi:GNAT superfamily N-acetyltransferase